MNLYDSLPDAAATIFGAEALAERSYEVLTVDVPAGSWISSLEIARDKLGCTYFDWLSAVDEPGTGFRVCAHVVSLENHHVRRLLLRTTVPHSAPSLPSAVAVYAGAEWHERETHEMFGVVFTDHPHLVPLLLPENFEGHPLRKDFVLAARVAKAWPGAKEPGEAHDPNAPKRRQMLPPGVPDPNDWGPMKGQLPPAPARPARGARAAAAGAAAAPGAEAPARPARRTRSVTEGSTSQAATPVEPGAQADTPRPARRTRSASEGSASQAATPAAPATPVEPGAQADTPRPARRTRSASEGSASQAAAPAAPAEPEAEGGQDDAAPGQAVRGRTVAPGRRPAPRSTDAPWHNPQPAFVEPEPDAAPEPAPEAAPRPDAEPDPARGTGGGPAPGTGPAESESETNGGDA
ncbi:NADH-quinone oxidoreductase subunit C [Streptomyces vinaceus]|uniref:NADH-quinone oxidoreductase subunit C n=1 Tax=Streptomyces vinaceus TaxID=1960 RepID=A0A5J6J6B8_STRVI|nr:NADH-quinone oxidoreductase subunit C [Streptomyces vinaceus]QEV46095.1 NADH-quinone oxidoreductase subunit C [Streptomyces vinaceus]GHE47615.1 dehydrogenase [Streptomyces vinaceus]